MSHMALAGKTGYTCFSWVLKKMLGSPVVVSCQSGALAGMLAGGLCSLSHSLSIWLVEFLTSEIFWIISFL